MKTSIPMYICKYLRVPTPSLPDGSDLVLWFLSNIMSSISPISNTFFLLHRFERNIKGFLLLLMLVLDLLKEVAVAPDVGMVCMDKL